MYHEMNCRVCHTSGLRSVLNLGDMHLNDFPLPEQPLPPKAPLDLCICDSCRLVQLRHSVDPSAMFTQFFYQSKITNTMRAALANVVTETQKHISAYDDNSPVVDIGSNDGTLLSYWPEQLQRIGFEPAKNLAGKTPASIRVVNDYFSAKRYWETTDQRASAVTAVAVFYDLDDPHQFCAEVRRILHPEGVFCVQVFELDAMINNLDVGNICHEHLTYYTAGQLAAVLRSAGLHPFHASRNQTNGGSLRMFASFKTRKPTPEYADIIEQDGKRTGALSDRLSEFVAGVDAQRQQLRNALDKAPKPIYAYGASTKGNTMLQWWNLGPEQIQGAAERDPYKYGRRTVTDIPICSEEEARERANTFLVLPWAFRTEMLEREEEWLIRPNHQMIFPSPKVEVVTGD